MPINKVHIYHRGQFNRVSDASAIKNIPDGAVLVDGFLSKCEDVTSSNGYRYERDFWVDVCKRDEFRDRLNAREMLGCIEHPVADEDYMYTDYKQAALMVLDVDVRGSDPFGIIGLLNNDDGTRLKSIVEFGGRIGVSTRGIGATKQKDSYAIVDAVGYSVITWDSVRNPNLPVTLGAISDSMLSNPRFKEMFDAVKLRDSGSGGFNRSVVEDAIKKMGAEAKAYMAAASGVRKKVISDATTLVRAKSAYDKFIADGGTPELLMKKANTHALAYAYLCSL